MLKLSKKLVFAIEAVVDIAFNAGTEPVQSGEITRRQGIPRRYLEQVLQQLVREGILAGVRGPRGGYRLARERRRISVGDIVRVVRSLETSPKDAEHHEGSAIGTHVVQPLWQSISDDVMARLDATTVEDLCIKCREVGIKREAEGPIDFVI